MNLDIDQARLALELDALGAISQEAPPVVTRVVFTKADVRGREFVKSLCREAGLTIREDAVGNTFARWTGEDPSLEPVGTGSHIDAIPNAGRFDGTVGVLGGLEAIRALTRAGYRPRRSIELVILFADSNGVKMQLLPVTSTAATVSGSLTFGINTQTNNALGTATVFPLSGDSFTTEFSNQTLTDSFIDSGSNALFFPSTITVCPPPNSSFYCPAGLTAESASNVGAGGSPTSVVPFNIDNADTLFNSNPGDAAFGTLAGPQGTANTCTAQGTGSCSFDWGLPFFYGRSVFTAIDGASVTNVGTGPFWAY